MANVSYNFNTYSSSFASSSHESVTALIDLNWWAANSHVLFLMYDAGLMCDGALMCDAGLKG